MQIEMSIGTQGWLDGAAAMVSHVRMVLIFLLSMVLSIVGEAPGAATGPPRLMTASLLRRMECALWMHDNGPALTLLPGASTPHTVRRAVPVIDHFICTYTYVRIYIYKYICVCVLTHIFKYILRPTTHTHAHPHGCRLYSNHGYPIIHNSVSSSFRPNCSPTASSNFLLICSFVSSLR